jgi:hypothetical protein
MRESGTEENILFKLLSMVILVELLLSGHRIINITSFTQVAFLPFGLLIDMWRWDVFSGKINESQWNSHWWKLR